MTEDEIAKIIVNSAFNVHVALGPGLLESAYEACLIYELLAVGAYSIFSGKFANSL
jgi:GxxExxY protein